MIAIIAILAAILFPVFARARENARRSSCQSNLKQIGLGILQYTQDYDEKFPFYWNSQGFGSNFGSWSTGIQPYMKSIQIFQCPSETTEPSNDSSTSKYNDYAYNMWLGYTATPGPPVAFANEGKSLAALTQSALTVMVMDSRGGQASAFYGTGLTSEDGNGGSATAHLAIFTDATASQRHLEGQNFLFCDGHVKWYKGSSPNTSSAVWGLCTPGASGGQLVYGCAAAGATPVSGNSPTFNLYP